MSLLDFDDHYVPPYQHKRPYKPAVKDNFAELQNLGHEKVNEDYSDEIERLD